MSKYFGLFGEKQEDKANKYAEIAADNFGEAIMIMKREHKKQWHIMLDESEFETLKQKRPELTRDGGVLC